jgi:hypothetical protein
LLFATPVSKGGSAKPKHSEGGGATVGGDDSARGTHFELFASRRPRISGISPKARYRAPVTSTSCPSMRRLPREFDDMLTSATADFQHIASLVVQPWRQYFPDRRLVAMERRRVETRVAFSNGLRWVLSRGFIHDFSRRQGSSALSIGRRDDPGVYGAVTVPTRLSIITGELRKSIVGGPPNLASTIALHSPP